MLKLEPLYYLNQVYHFNSVKYAAESIPVAASTVSSSIHKLEKELGIPLLLRTYQGIELTEEAVQIAQMAEGVLEGISEIENYVASRKAPSAEQDGALLTPFTVYIPQGWYQIRSRPMMEWLERNTQMTIEIPDKQINDTHKLLEVDGHVGSVYITYLQEPSADELKEYPNVRFISVKTGRPAIMCAKNSKLVPDDIEDISPKEVLNLPVLRYTEGFEQEMPVLEMLEDYGRLNIVENYFNLAIMAADIERDKGVSVTNDISINAEIAGGMAISNRVRIIPIRTSMRMTLGICYNKELSAPLVRVLKSTARLMA